MAVLISKVVRSSSAERVDDEYSGGNHTSNPTNVNRRTTLAPWKTETNISGGMAKGVGDEDRGAGIMKTTMTVIKSDSDGESCEGYQLSTKTLTRDMASYRSSSADVSSSP
jgi:hypothetical protein